jgi:outer membrane lipoprotein SlyB
MRIRFLSILPTLLLPTLVHATQPDYMGQAIVGGGIGGAIGSQIGGGQGKIAATAVGAAVGVVVASGCTATPGTVLGGLLGGLIGSQFGGGRGKNVMAGVGAGIGALMGSDCKPGSKPAAVVPLPNTPPISFNGIVMTPVNGFPQEAFRGVPPIVTPSDIFAATKMVRSLYDLSAKAQADNNVELSILSMYWAKRISAETMSVLSASFQSIKTNTGTSAAIPAKGLVILPAFNENKRPENNTALLNTMKDMVATNSYAGSKGVLVADNSGFSAAMDLLGKLSQQPRPQPVPSVAAQMQPTQVSTLPKKLVELPLNVVMSLPGGALIMKSEEALTIYNPNSEIINLPLDRLDFMPRTPSLSAARRAATDLMFAVSSAENDWSFNVYKKQVNGFELNVSAPAKLIDITRGNKVIAYFDEQGQISTHGDAGMKAYKTQSPYKRAIDTLEAIDNSTLINQFTSVCTQVKMGSYSVLDGLYANKLQAICFKGNYADNNYAYVRSYYVGEGAEIVQTAESLNRDLNNQKVMALAMATGSSVSDALSFVPGVGTVESGLSCLGRASLAQTGFVSSVVMDAGVKSSARANVSNTDLAKLSGWTPPSSDEWGFDRVVSCASAIPLVGSAASAVKVVDKGAAYLGASILSDVSKSRLDLLQSVTKAFDSPITLDEYAKGVKEVKDLVPNNPRAATLVKTFYDVLMSGQSMSQTADGFKNLYAE